MHASHTLVPLGSLVLAERLLCEEQLIAGTALVLPLLLLLLLLPAFVVW